ncbi:stage V sporulation protein AB [Natronincola ferrireducens]|uniref:Stage V sporulation protein AB n=1 Tax=Natronincola ferrireducens TaxID=393762 RepID=A0A1G9D7V3_9FIRM|nr:stage V sporulation protein AB [Natronincola ferrireducens]SDK59795.1 stage V sporulation protein AB [Natronincola ferrireducens]
MVKIIIPLIGLSNGIIVGSGIVALLTLLDIIPRIAQLTKTYKNIWIYENTIIISATIASLFSLTTNAFNTNIIFVTIIGLFMGIFIGLLASALAEVMNVIPVVVRRFQIEEYVIYVVYALISGKMLGSFIHWLIIH